MKKNDGMLRERTCACVLGSKYMRQPALYFACDNIMRVYYTVAAVCALLVQQISGCECAPNLVEYSKETMVREIDKLYFREYIYFYNSLMNSDVHADIANYTIYATNNHVEISCSALVSQNSNINVRRWDCTIGNDIIFPRLDSFVLKVEKCIVLDFFQTYPYAWVYKSDISQKVSLIAT